VKKSFLNFFVKGGGHAIWDFRIIPEKFEEKKGYKNVCQNYFFN
jgi:hypothetical protein